MICLNQIKVYLIEILFYKEKIFPLTKVNGEALAWMNHPYARKHELFDDKFDPKIGHLLILEVYSTCPQPHARENK